MSYYILKFYDENNNLVHTSLEDDVFDVKLDGQKITGVDFFQTEGRSSKITVDAESNEWYLYNLYTNPVKMRPVASKIIEDNQIINYQQYKVQILYGEDLLFTGYIKYDSVKYDKKEETIDFTLDDSVSLFIYGIKNIEKAESSNLYVYSGNFENIMINLLDELIFGWLRLNISYEFNPFSYETGYNYPNEKLDSTDYSELGDGITSWLSLYDFGEYISFNYAYFNYNISIRQTGPNQYKFSIGYSNKIERNKINGINLTEKIIDDLGSATYEDDDIYATYQLAFSAAEAIALDFINIPKLYQVNKKELTTANGIYSVFDYLRYSGILVLSEVELVEDAEPRLSSFIKNLFLIFNASISSKPNGNLQIANKLVYNASLPEITIDEDNLFSYNSETILRTVPNFAEELLDMFTFSVGFGTSLNFYYKNKLDAFPKNLSIEVDLDGTEYNILQRLSIFDKTWIINSIKKDYKNETIKIDCWG